VSYKICYIASSYYPSPGGTTPFEISRHMARLGHKVSVIVPKMGDQVDEELIDGVRVYRVNLLLRRPTRLANVIFSVKAFKILRQYTYDLIHVSFSPQQSVLPILGKLLLGTKRPRWIFHLISGSIETNRLRKYLQDRKMAIESRFFDAVLTSNDYIKRRLLGNYSRQPCFIVPIGVNLSQFKPLPQQIALNMRKRWNVGENEAVLIYVGTFTSRNLSILIEVFKEVLNFLENSKLFLVGSGEGLEDLKEIACQLGVADQVIFTGHVMYNEIPMYLCMADIAISYIPINAIYDIQPPLKTLEYLAAGLPVVATATLANRIFIKDGHNGVLVEDSVESLSDGIVKLLTDDALRRRLAVHARQSVEHLDWTKVVENFLVPAYDKILQKR